MTWELFPPPTLGWILVSDGVAVESLTWNAGRKQYCNRAGIACGESWNEAKAACESKVTKAKKVGSR